MLKILYILPALAILGMLPAADAATDQELQERIDRLQAKVDSLQKRIDAADPDRDAKRIDKWEEKIAKHEMRIADLQARMEGQPTDTARFTETPEEPEPRALKHTSGDTTPPTVSSATLDGSTLTVVFDETIDFDNLFLTTIFLGDGSNSLEGATVANPSTNSDTLSLTLSETLSDAIRNADDPSLSFARGSVADVSRNPIGGVNVPVTVDGSTPPNTTPPTVSSATLDGTTLTVVFDETIDLSEVYLEEILLGEYTLADSSFDDTAGDSDTLILGLSQASLDTIGALENPALDFNKGAVSDTDGNGLEAVTVPITVTNAPEETPVEETPDNMPVAATVTITADGRLVEDTGTLEIQLGGDMTFDVKFENLHDNNHIIRADLISWDFEHQREDISLDAGNSKTVTYTIQGDAPRIGDENANVYLVFGVADILDTPENEPDTITGDHAIKIRITEPAS